MKNGASFKMLKELLTETKEQGNKNKAKFLASYFKTGRLGYPKNDVFYGISVPQSRKIAKKFKNLNPTETIKLLNSQIHEERLIALLIFVNRCKTTKVPREAKDIFDAYLSNIECVNNWDLVDLSAEHIIGKYLYENNKSLTLLVRLAKSKNLWKRRISVLCTFYYIKKGEYKPTLQIIEMLISDHEDLIHKACGWMLREVGKRELQTEQEFLKKHYKRMPRTMLRYAIEKFAEEQRQEYLKGLI